MYGVEFVDERVAMTADTVSGLRRMDAGSKDISIRGGITRVTETADALKGELGSLSVRILYCGVGVGGLNPCLGRAVECGTRLWATRCA